ncbi:hypothetical protein [Variovorax paradoxus]|jgi:hypothetical protein|uniref:hypothetical protein n=1 Tax=Variovorax paradoxus TaxID=34073 RepID=UPI002480EB9F|nr:hypothetical protein [Variovorax paradoxus]WGT64667.1 hypothetical protein QHG62_04805 [Variovorax paradoxus]
MLNQVIHNATITLQLPLDLSADAEIAALRSAGIPVDELGNATSGYLFVRTTGRGDHLVNTFRWFATSIGKAPAGSVQNVQAPGSAVASASAW